MKRKYSLFIATALFGLVGCKEMISVKPTEQIDAVTALNSKSNFEAATYGVYSTLRDVSLYGRNLIVYGDALADNLLHTNVSTSLVSIYNNNTGAHFNNWDVAYKGVNRANLILQGLENFQATPSWKDGIAAQVHFLRALLYFDLVKVYAYDPTYVLEQYNRGGVPLQTKGVILVDQMEIKPRSTINEVYEFIYKDIDSAVAKLRRTGGGGISSHRVTLSAAHALYSRVALHKGDYRKSADHATAAISGSVGKLSTTGSYVTDWRAEKHPESIFEIKVNVNENLGANNSLRATYTSRAFLNSQEPATHGLFAISDALLSLYGSTDVRKDLVMKGLGNNINRNEMTKFISKGGVKDLDNIPVFRMAEMYLNRAEAYYNLTKQDSALIDLNHLITNRGLNEVNLSNSNLYEEIIKQRRLEFAFEGYRWFDLKRLGRNITKNGTTLSSTSFKLLAIIPYSEVNSSKGVIRQNRGY